MCSRFRLKDHSGIPRTKNEDVYDLFYLSGHSAHKHKPGHPPLSLLALFPIDLYSLIKTNQGGILLVDSI